MRLLTSILLMLVAASVLKADAICNSKPSGGTRHEIVIEAPGERAFFELSDRFVLATSDTVFLCDSLLLRESDYWIDYSRGIVFLRKSVPQECALRIVYCALPLGLKPDYRLREILETSDSRQIVAKPVPSPSADRRSHDLKASGIKSIRIEAGSLGDPRVTQSLDLTVTGSVGQAEVRGVLSDRDMVLGSASSTSRLRDLDRIFMEVTSPKASAKVGDIEIDESPGELVMIQRQATGLYTRGLFGSKEIVASAMTNRSMGKSIVIRAREGVTGPYEIASGARGYVSIIRNSEKVYLDGKALKRGEGADYTMDYDKGLIYFNPAISPREGSRIVVTYDIESDTRDQVYYLGSALNLNSKARLGVAYASEQVSANGSLDTSEASAVPVERWADGGRKVGWGFGDYIRVVTDSLSYYRYVGEGLGDYTVRFTRVMDGQGTYSLVYSEIWQREIYVYTTIGSFIDKVPTSYSERVDAVHIGASFEPLDWLKVGAELGRSKGISDGVSSDKSASDAYVLSLEGRTSLPDIASSSLGQLKFAAKRKVVGSRFVRFDGRPGPDFYERWGHEGGGGEASNDLRISYGLPGLLNFSASSGRLRSPGGKSSNRTLGGELSVLRTNLSFASERTDVQCDGRVGKMASDHIKLGLPLSVTNIEFGAGLRIRDLPSDSLSFWRSEYHASVGCAIDALKTSAMVSVGDEKRLVGGSWIEYLSVITADLGFVVDLSRRLSLKSSLLYRNLDYKPQSGLVSAGLSGIDLHVDAHEIALLNRFLIDYDLSRRLSGVYTSQLVKVDGIGDYDSLGNYLPGAGSHALASQEIGKKPVMHSALKAELEFGKNRKLLGKQRISSRTTIRLDSESSSEHVGKSAFSWRPRKDIVLASRFLNEEIIYRHHNGMTVKLEGLVSTGVDARCDTHRESKERYEMGSKVIGSAPWNMGFEAEARMSNARSKSEIRTRRTLSNHKRTSGSLRLGKNFDSHIRGELGFELASELRDVPLLRSLIATLKPALIVQWKLIRLDSSVNVRRVVGSTHSPDLPMPPRNSTEWNSRVDFRQGQHVSFSLEYRLTATDGLPSLHSIRSSLNACF